MLMKKYVTAAALVLLVAGCSNTATETETPAEQTAPSTTTPVVEEPSEVVTEEPNTQETPLATDENLDFEDDVTQFEAWIAQMRNWQSYKAVLDNYDTYPSEEGMTNSEYHEAIEYVATPLQLFQSTHRIAFSNDHMERYIVENAETGMPEGVERFSFEEWQPVEDVEYYIKNIAPARADMLQGFIDYSPERLVSEDGQTVTLNIAPESTLDAYDRLMMGINFAVAMDALTDDIQGQIDMVETDVTRMAATIYSDGSEITGYDIQVYAGEAEEAFYSYEEKFSDMNTLEYTTTPEDL